MNTEHQLNPSCSQTNVIVLLLYKVHLSRGMMLTRGQVQVSGKIAIKKIVSFLCCPLPNQANLKVVGFRV